MSHVNCKGCSLKNSNGCIIKIYDRQDTCPCRECLVKVACDRIRHVACSIRLDFITEMEPLGYIKKMGFY